MTAAISYQLVYVESAGRTYFIGCVAGERSWVCLIALLALVPVHTCRVCVLHVAQQLLTNELAARRTRTTYSMLV